MSPVRKTTERLKKLRRQLCWSQRKLAELSGLSREYLARLETARQDPTLSTLEGLARVPKVQVTDLVK